MMIDEGMPKDACIEKIDKMANNHALKGLWRTAKDNPRPSIWNVGRWQDEMDNYK